MEDLIRRASAALGMGVSEADFAEKLMGEGFTPETAYLAVKAAAVFNKDQAPITEREPLIPELEDMASELGDILGEV